MVVNGWNIAVIALVAVAGYMLGNIQTSLIVSKLAFGDDVRKYGSGNPGTTNMVRVFGKKPGLITFLGDAGKSLIAYLLGRLIGRLLGLNTDDAALAAAFGGCIGCLSACIGHCYPVFYKFRGGKAAACSFSLMYCFCWQAAIAATVIFIIVFIIWRRVSLVSISAAILFSIFTGVCVALGWTEPYILWFAIAATCLVLWRHVPNIKRLLRGEEAQLKVGGKQEPNSQKEETK